MSASRYCTASTDRGGRCRARPVHGSTLCFWHNPETAAEAAIARELGGRRRRREGALAGAYALEDLDSVEGLTRALEVAFYEALALENSVARDRVLANMITVGTRLLQVRELEARVTSLEAAIKSRP